MLEFEPDGEIIAVDVTTAVVKARNTSIIATVPVALSAPSRGSGLRFPSEALIQLQQPEPKVQRDSRDVWQFQSRTSEDEFCRVTADANIGGLSHDPPNVTGFAL